MKTAFLASAALCLSVGLAFAEQPDDARLNAAIGYFNTICVGPGGDLKASIKALSDSSDFGDGKITDAGSLTYGSFTGPDRINASVKMGFDDIMDHCTIIVKDSDRAMATAHAIALRLADGDAERLLGQDGFGDYPDGGYVVELDGGSAMVAPLGTGVSAEIVHINFFPGV
ncbi:hypothetical protein [Paracoccus sp. R86501]|uniref:hypothetical protein n=1 Tax=Paracoccus sp. R86501 TaxID=3101711 RepID=UPI00366A9C57